nr:MAG TPA: hypothetical protein [Caudoviricetes sp.]
MVMMKLTYHLPNLKQIGIYLIQRWKVDIKI